MYLLQALLIGLLVLLVRLDHYHAGGALGACGCTQVLQRTEKGSLPGSHKRMSHQSNLAHRCVLFVHHCIEKHFKLVAIN